MTRRVLVTGSRVFTNTAVIREALAGQWGDGTAVLVVGVLPARADMLAEQCWRAWGGRVERHPAQWQRDGRAAGFTRNTAMVATGAYVCLAFLHGPSRGTRHTAALAARAGIPTRRYAQPDATDITRATPRGTTTDITRESGMSNDNDNTNNDRGSDDHTATGVTADTTGDAAEDEHRGDDLPPTQWDLSPAERDIEARTDAGGLHGWMFQGDEAAYDAYLTEFGPIDDVAPDQDAPAGVSGAADEVDHTSTVNDDATDGDGLSDEERRFRAAYPTGMPPDMLDGIEERRTCPAKADDPAELHARLAALRRRIADRHPTPDQARADELIRWAQQDQRPDDATESGRGW